MEAAGKRRPGKQSESYPLTGTDVVKVAGGGRKTQLYTYDELDEFDTIEDAFGGKRGIMLLYVHTNPAAGEGVSGHWTSLLKRTPDEIVFTDSYGRRLDSTLEDYTPEHRAETDQDVPKLTLLLRDWCAEKPSVRKVVYNNVGLQRKSDRIATCGRWAAYRLRWPDVDEDTYERSVKAAAREAGITTDALIVKATNALLH